MSPISFLLGCILIHFLLSLGMHQTTSVRAFTSTTLPRRPASHSIRPSTTAQKTDAVLRMARYGPPDVPLNADRNDDGPAPIDDAYRSTVRSRFAAILREASNLDAAEELPSLVTKHVDDVLAAMTMPGVIEEIIREEVRTGEGRLEDVSEVVDAIVTCVESFVEQVESLDDGYKKLLGKIFRILAPEKNNQLEGRDEAGRFEGSVEGRLDELLAAEKEAFTPGFLRHLEGECGRIAALPVLSPESAKMLQILRMIQARVLEELGKGIGEGAIVLGQLLGYDDKAERLAVLDAGLTVRGVEFACELSALTGEALKGFEHVKDVDPGLVKSIREIDDRIGLFMEKSRFQ
ncbi:hypothetical protein ACHAWX_000544 [Stephanocyclus meneghinianus]